MKRKMTLTIALVLSVVMLSLIKSDSTANAQKPQRFVKDTGIVTLAPNQILRITVNGEAGPDTINVRFRRLEYMQSTCNGGVCIHAISAQTTSAPIMLAPNEGASADLGDTATHEVRGVVVSNSRKVQVLAQIINMLTNEVVVAFLPADLDNTTIGE